MSAIRFIDNRFLNECVVRDGIATLRSLHRAIPAWERLAGTELDAQGAVDLSGLSDRQRHWYDDNINDQNYLMAQTVNALYAGLAVSIVSFIESVMGMLCEEQGVQLPSRPNWGHKAGGLAGRRGLHNLSSLPSFGFADRARLLGNCFKHEGGKTNSEWVASFGGSEDTEIFYAGEDWGAIIGGANEFLLAVVHRLPAT